MLNQGVLMRALGDYIFFKGEPPGELCMNRWTYELCKKQGVDFADLPIVIDHTVPQHMIYMGERGQFSAKQT